jgi:FKBP-type peptidyl-prolyl cis-trans isomerase (trigger factor)
MVTSATKGEPPQQDNFDLSNPNLLPELKEALLGKSQGSKLGLSLPAAPDESASEGKATHYNITVDAVLEKNVPELGPEFYKQVLGAEAETEEAFREEFKKRLTSQVDVENTNRAREDAIRAIEARSVLEIPASLLKRQVDYQIGVDNTNSQVRYKVGLEEFLRKSSINVGQYMQQAQVQAGATLRRSLVIDELGRKFSVQVEADDLEEEIARRAAAARMDITKARAAFYKDEERLYNLERELRHNKVAGLILDHVTVKEVDQLSSPAPTPFPSPEVPEVSDSTAAAADSSEGGL